MNPEFYNRVGFIGLKVAQNVASESDETANHDARVAYANRFFTGMENYALLSQHLASSNPTIYATMENEGGAAVPDGDIEFALATIWDSRSIAYAPGAIVAPAPQGDLTPHGY
jgi:hypothetical protein